MKNFDNTFNREKGNDSRERDVKMGDPGKRQFGNRERERPPMHEAICSDCGKRCEVPFRPTGDKPVYCNECFDRGGDSLNKNNDRAVNQYKEQFEMLNAKLDRIIKALIPVVPVIEKKKEVIVKKKKAIVEKKEKVKKPKKV